MLVSKHFEAIFRGLVCKELRRIERIQARARPPRRRPRATMPRLAWTLAKSTTPGLRLLRMVHSQYALSRSQGRRSARRPPSSNPSARGTVAAMERGHTTTASISTKSSPPMSSVPLRGVCARTHGALSYEAHRGHQGPTPFRCDHPSFRAGSLQAVWRHHQSGGSGCRRAGAWVAATSPTSGRCARCSTSQAFLSSGSSVAGGLRHPDARRQPVDAGG